MVGPIWSVVAEVDEARLVGMKCESIPSKTLAQYVEDPFGIEDILECHHGIIGEADKGTSPLEAWPHLDFEPFIQHVVQVLRGFGTRCLRFTSVVATTHAKLASGWLARLYREGLEPSGPLHK